MPRLPPETALFPQFQNFVQSTCPTGYPIRQERVPVRGIQRCYAPYGSPAAASLSGYEKHPTLIARSAMGGWTDAIKSIAGSTYGVFAASEQAKGAISAQNAAALQRGATGGIQPMTIILLGGVGLAAYLLLRKKKPA